MREVILDGLSEVFILIDSTIKLDFKDFKEEKLEGLEETEKMAKEDNIKKLVVKYVKEYFDTLKFWKK